MNNISETNSISKFLGHNSDEAKSAPNEPEVAEPRCFITTNSKGLIFFLQV